MSIPRDNWEEQDDVFEYLSEPVESVQDYVPGGLHPIYLGDTFKDGRYTISRKLGYGRYSTVWLAQDNSENGSFVAVKVVRADSNCAKEIQIYDRLRASADQHGGSSSVMMLKDQFCIVGPNGKHDCLAYEVLGPSVGRVRDDSAAPRMTAYLTLSCARRVVYQVPLGLDYMHSLDLVHGDLYAANVLFAVKDLSDEPIINLYQPHDQVSVDVKRISGPQQPGDPRHLTLDRPLNRFLLTDGKVKLSDLGNRFLGIWLLDLQPAYKLLPVRSSLYCTYDQDSRNDAHMIQLFSFLGPLPDKLKSRWPRYSVYFDKGQLKKFEVDDDAFSYPEFDTPPPPEKDCRDTTPNTMNGVPEKNANKTPSNALQHHSRKPQELFDPICYPSIFKICERKIRKDQGSPESLAEFSALNPLLKERWLDQKHPDMELEEAELVLDLLQGLFTYDPKQRLSTKALLQHAWIQNYFASGDFSKQVAAESRKKRKRSRSEEEREDETKRVV